MLRSGAKCIATSGSRAVALAGLAPVACFAGMAVVGNLRANLVPFLVLNGTAFLFYAVAVWLTLRAHDEISLAVIFGFAVLFRVAVLFASPPTLSDDVYRYMWDGHLVASGINPYMEPVNSRALDPYATPFRALVNHAWMASPYLPVAQAYFACITTIWPGSSLPFQIGALALDLLTGLILIDMLRRTKIPREYSLIYLWNPLIVVEFSHGAHVDSLMIFLIMLSFWALAAHRSRVGSGIAMAAATLTKGIPALLLPTVWHRWGWKGVLAFASALVVGCLPFALGAGLGIAGPESGTGLLGAIRIYANEWNFNSGIHHWIENLLMRSPVAGALPSWTSRAIMGALMAAVVGVSWIGARKNRDALSALWWAAVPLGGYLLLTTTLHPWYATIILPFLPFLAGRRGEPASRARFILPWLVFSALVSLSYLTYLDPENLRELGAVRLAQYVPLYSLLCWAAWPAIAASAKTGSD